MQSLFTIPAILASQKRIGSLREALLLKRSLLSCPGVRIQEQLDYFSLCEEQLRFFLGLSSDEFSQLLEGKLRIGLVLAAQLEVFFDIDGSFWLGLEQHYQQELFEIAKLELKLAKEQQKVYLFKNTINKY